MVVAPILEEEFPDSKALPGGQMLYQLETEDPEVN